MIARAKIAHFADQGRHVRGVVHVGAHEGQEIPWYLQQGHVPVIAFEPNPEPLKRLLRAFGRDSRVIAIPIALSDTTGPMELWIPRHLHDAEDDEQSASLHRADPDSGYPWGERDRHGRTVRVPVIRFDEWVRVFGAQSLLSACDSLVIDVQGHELEVLRGFGDELGGFNHLVVECSEIPIYKGGAPARAVVEFLAERGFRQDSPIVDHDDIFFVREGL